MTSETLSFNQKRIGISKESSYYSVKRFKIKHILLLANKLIGKLPDTSNFKEHYESFLRYKNRKLVKQSEILIYQAKTFFTVYIKSVITEHPKTSYKLSKTIRQAEKVSSNSSLYSDTYKTKKWKFFEQKKYKNKKMIL